MMKKIGLVIIALVVFSITIGCLNTREIVYRDSLEHDLMNDITYKFTGKSDHFGFETGKVDLNDNKRDILITNFTLVKEFKKIDYFHLSLYFNKELFYDTERNVSPEDIENQLNDIVIAQFGYMYKDENGQYIGEYDAFTKTSAETFKNNIDLKIKYCADEKCVTEQIKLSYIN